MKRIFLKWSLAAVLFAIVTETNAQKRIGIVGFYALKSNALNLSPMADSGFSSKEIVAEMIDFYSRNDDFIILDRQNTQAINKERELQKNEQFLEGYVIEQGKGEGLDYVIFGIYNLNNQVLKLYVGDVDSGQTLGSASGKITPGLIGMKSLEKQMTPLLLDLNVRCFDQEVIVVRSTKTKGDKAKELLVAAGLGLKVREGYEFEIYINQEELIQGKKLKRQELIGKAEVLTVHDENFCTMEVSKGSEEILKALNEKLGVFAKMITD